MKNIYKLGFLFVILITNLYSKDIDLKFVLQNITKNDENIKLFKEDLKLDKINLELTNNVYKPTVHLEGQYGRQEKFGKNINDSYAYLVFKKNIYNEKKNITANTIKLNNTTKSKVLSNVIQNEKIEIMKKYFDIFLSKLNYEYNSERIVMIYSHKKHADDNIKIGRASSIDVYKTTSDLLDAQNILYQAKENQDITKQILGNSVNIDPYKNNFVKPEIKFYWDEITKSYLDSEKLKAKMYKNNFELNILKEQLQNTSSTVKSLKINNNIKVSVNAKVGSEPILANKYDDIRWEGSLNISVPLYDTNNDIFTIKKLKIKETKLKLQISKKQKSLNEKLLTLISNIRKNIRLKEMLYTKYDYADLNSEKSRSLFEMDRRSDLGNSFTLITKVQYEFTKNEYDFVLNKEKLNLLIGEKNEIY